MNIKMTTGYGTTKNNFLWGENVTHQVNFSGNLCREGMLHFYEHELIAEFMRHNHGYQDDVLAWECEPHGRIVSDGTKSGCGKLTTIRQVKLPTITSEQRTEIAIRLVMKYRKPSPRWIEWASKWLSGEDRTAKSAGMAGETRSEAARAATWVATWAAVRADACEWAAETATVIAEKSSKKPDLLSIIQEVVGK